jgi:hypothetical protein
MEDARMFDTAHFGWHKGLVEKCFLGTFVMDGLLRSHLELLGSSQTTLHISSVAIATLSRGSGKLMAANRT